MTLPKAFAIISCLILLTGCPEEPAEDPPVDENKSDNNTMMGNNKAPVADPGENFDAVVGERVEVSGAASDDPDGDLITPLWVMEPPEGSQAVLDKTTEFRTGFVPDIEGIYKLTLVVNDGKIDSDAVPVFVRAKKETGGGETNLAPVANAGEDATLFIDQAITLDGSASSDPNDDPLTYSWLITESPSNSQATLNANDIARPELLADLPGLYEAELVVNDGELDSTPDLVRFTIQDVTSANTPPVAGADVPVSIVVGQAATFEGSPSTDADGDALSFTWTLLGAPMGSAAMIEDATNQTSNFTADLEGNYSFELVVNDGETDSVALPFMVFATQVANTPPVAVTSTRLFTLPGQALALDGSESFDDEGQPLTFRWRLMQKPVGSAILLENANAEMASITPDVDGDYDIELVVNDGIENSAPVNVTVTAAARPDNCLIISEYIEGDGNNKAIELYNCDDEPIALDGVFVCIVRNGSNPTCTSPLALSGSLGIGDVVGVCNSQFDMSDLDAGDCDFTGGAMTFNGDDRLVVFQDLNMDGQYDFGDQVLDAFGEISQDPVGKEWEDTTYRRCNVTPYDGVNMPFDVTAFFDDFFTNDYSDFGLPPTFGVMCGAPPVNRMPVANAGPARTITTGQTITLDGSGSSDPDNDIVTFMWTMTQSPVGSVAMLDDATLEQPSFTLDLDGMYTIELVVNDGALDSTVSSVTITSLPPVMPGSGCLLISEVIEGTSNNKAVELYNCGTDSVSLDDINICLISNDNSTCSTQSTLQLSGQLIAGSVIGICNSGLNMAGIDPGDCTYTNAVTNFNGNDRLLLYRDNNDDGVFDALGDEILDAFGETSVKPSSEIWKDTSYRRCNLGGQYNGMGAFDVMTYYTNSATTDDVSDFGVPPMAGVTCP